MKNFDGWNKLKHNIEDIKNKKFFKVREIWWCFLGSNIGHEEDGKGESFQRPVLIVKKYNKDSLLGIALSSKNKNNEFYYSFDMMNKKYFVILSQLKFFSSKRLINKIGRLDSNIFNDIKNKIIRVNFE